MHKLREKNTGVSPSSGNTSLPTSEMDDNSSSLAGSGGGAVGKPKTPLRKDELERIAQQLKRRLLKASITAKQAKPPDRTASAISYASLHTGVANDGSATRTSATSTASSGSAIRSRQHKSPSVNGILSSSPIDLYSPSGRSPTHMRTPSALYNMRRNNGSDSSLLGSPSRGRTGTTSGTVSGTASGTTSAATTVSAPASASASASASAKQPQMVLQELAPSTPGKHHDGALDAPTLEPSPVLNSTSNPQTTPTLPKKQLATLLLQTPTQPQRTPRNGNGNFNDTEGADLLMYLATSPSPARSFTTSSSKYNGGNHSANGTSHNFIAPPPLTPKRPHVINSKTPQRLTPLVNLLSTFNAAGLPSSALTLTPAGFNMNDYVNFFTPSPGAAMAAKPVPRTPDVSAKQVDGKMINFDRVGLFNGENKD